MLCADPSLRSTLYPYSKTCTYTTQHFTHLQCCWVTGWLNLLGQIAAISAVAALAADLITTMARMATALDGGTPVEIDK